ncbi:MULTISPECIES: hypothetical protein [Arthrospira]|uniref:hypothetical protein n=1 Tax=Oscillatoriales TaxID=1150 RepID=UPI0012FFCD1B|nr:hypothetical protein [Arthrospira platensis]MBD2669480.1 hypothetical protein [Arthrospira platensis FACHB-439]MBD2710053.1 hypothetical protein [Arthrospira platensis FACHB-835]MDF2212189.1 hypothetical protein [Arthrospira platensis NCB002]QQW27753.1 hypothetical protein AP9108_21550 [Arthrospira sp. PCC 9108]MBD2573076.1 hypothetical protein [Arthrospira platensis FACHB-971]
MYSRKLRVTAVATPSFKAHTRQIEAGNGRREVEPTTIRDHCQSSMIRETECLT